MAFGSIQNQNSSYLIKDDVSQILTNTNEILQDTASIGGGVQTLTNSNSVILTNTNTINTNVNQLLTNTNVNNTASSTGTLSQKLSYIINNPSGPETNVANRKGSLLNTFTSIPAANNVILSKSYTINHQNMEYTQGKGTMSSLSEIFLLSPGYYKITLNINNNYYDGSTSDQSTSISGDFYYCLFDVSVYGNFTAETFPITSTDARYYLLNKVIDVLSITDGRFNTESESIYYSFNVPILCGFRIYTSSKGFSFASDRPAAKSYSFTISTYS